ncbi:ATP-binding protein [Streptomyces sp. NRRL F-5630]|uniref:ATP-binding protein n=1 Tax=Streptomyces sp. NRRL F-5630 TaxID=1463864 RepID=UPI003D7356DB
MDGDPLAPLPWREDSSSAGKNTSALITVVAPFPVALLSALRVAEKAPGPRRWKSLIPSPTLARGRPASRRPGAARALRVGDNDRKDAVSAPGKDQAMLVGRHAEQAALERLLARARGGDSGVLVVRGEAGIGKSALLQHMRETAVAMGFGVHDAAGVEAEAEFAFAGLHQLCAPFLARAVELPEPQQAALGVAFGLREGAAPDRFLVGLAVLSLLAEDGPLLCVVDDAQWLDQASAQVLAFVARRVGAERVAMVFALRDPDVTDIEAFSGLPELRLAGLGASDAQTLLATAVRAPLDDVVRDRIRADRGCGVAVARGRGAGDRPRGGCARGGRRAAGVRLPCAVPAPAGALGGLPGGHTDRPAPGARRAGRRHRPAGRSGPACLAPRAGGGGH